MKLQSASFPVIPPLLPFEYPGLYQSGSIIVLMTESGTGMLLKSDKGSFYKLGDYRTEWDMTLFKPFEGEILLKSSKEEQT